MENSLILQIRETKELNTSSNILSYRSERTIESAIFRLAANL